MKVQNFILIILILILIIGLVVNYHFSDSRIKNEEDLEMAINEYLEKRLFPSNFYSKYFNEVYDSTSKMKFYAEMSGYPADLKRGLGKEYLDKCVNLANEKYDHKIMGYRINQEIEDNYINIYFLKDDPKGYFRDFKDNCAYTSYRNVIICDVNYIRNFQFVTYIERKLDSLNNQDDPLDILEENSGYYIPILLRNLAASSHNMLWVIGHEIGHLAHRHNGRHFYFNENSTLPHIEIQKETLADKFAIDAVEGTGYKGTDIAGALLFGLSNTLQDYHIMYCSNKDDHTINQCSDRFYIKSKNKTHPPMFLRATNFCIALDTTYLLSNQEYLRVLKKRIIVQENESI